MERGSERLFGDMPMLTRKWQAAVRPGRSLPRYEDVMLGSLGRLADHIALVKFDGTMLKVSRTGRFIQQWLGDERWDIGLDQLPPDCATAIEQATLCALENGRPYRAEAHCIREGLVQTCDLLALPTASRWGDRLIGVYVNAHQSPYNLVDAIFSSTDAGIVSLAAIRDAAMRVIDFQVVQLNQSASRLLSAPGVDFLWRRLSAGGHPLCTADAISWLRNVIDQSAQDQLDLDHDGRNLGLTAKTFGDLVSLTIADVTAVKRRKESFRLLFDNNPMPMWVFDAQTSRFLNVNAAAVEHYGYDRETFLTMRLADIWPQDERDAHMAAVQQLTDAYQSDRNWRHLRADGSEIQVLTFGRRVAFDGRDGFLVAIVDITERRKAEARVAHMAHHDGLTELANRVFFQERLGRALQEDTSSKRVAVLCVDLDLFKNVNDSFGHPMGDRLLQMVAARMKSQMREGDLVARLGGDEFAIMLASDASPNEVSSFAARLIDIVSAPYDIGGIEIVIGASIGIAIAPGDGHNCEELMRNADMALYRAKAEGGGCHRFFEREMDRQAQRRRDMEVDLRRAFANGEFELHYQPVVNLSNDRIVAFEALLRWRHPDKGMVSPAEFIPVAEDIGLIVQLGEWVLRTACAEAAQWPSDVKVAVNLSPAQFRSRNLVQVVIGALSHSGLSPLRLELEITESLLLAETEANLAILHQMRELGVRISMDDFGTGYSSLSYLRSFPFDKIKIDRSFVRELAERPDSGAIVRAISGLGRSLKITTTAEGVETRDQLDWLRAEGCDEVQGYIFSAARPAREVRDLLAAFGCQASLAA